MKTYEEMAQSALARGNAIRNQCKRRKEILVEAVSALAVCCLIITLVFVVRDKGLNLRGPYDLGETKPSDGPVNPGETVPSNRPVYPDAPLPSISLRSLAQLDEMREMISCSDEEKLNAYLRGIEGAGASSREDLISFVNLIDSLPILELIEGEITAISLNNIIADRNRDEVDISTQDANGNWTRVEYLLWVEDVNAEIEFREANGWFENSALERPIQSNDGRITVYAEVKEAHPSGIGYTVTWTVVVDGVLAYVVYRSEDIGDIHAERVFGNLVIGTLKP